MQQNNRYPNSTIFLRKITRTTTFLAHILVKSLKIKTQNGTTRRSKSEFSLKKKEKSKVNEAEYGKAIQNSMKKYFIHALKRKGKVFKNC